MVRYMLASFMTASAEQKDETRKAQTYFSDGALSVVYVSLFLNLRATPQAATKLYVIRLPQLITFAMASRSSMNAGMLMPSQIIHAPATGTWLVGEIFENIGGSKPSSACAYNNFG